MKRFFTAIWIFLLLAATACKTYYVPDKVNWRDYRVSSATTEDSVLVRYLQPFSDSINLTMNSIIAEVAETLEKKQPDGSLGNVLTDALLAMAEKGFNTKVDAAFINNGGIRLPVLPKGSLTVGKVYELMPFDNVIILQQMSGRQLKGFLDHISKRGGWPVSGLTYDIKNDMAVNVKINGRLLNEEATYTISNSDFIANGGDDCVMLKTIKQLNKNILMRDAFIDYFKELNANGKKITAPQGERVRKID